MQPTHAARMRAEAAPPSPTPAAARRPQRPAGDPHWQERLYEDRREGPGPTFLKKRSWDAQHVADWRRATIHRSMPARSSEARPPRPLRIPPEVTGHDILRGPPSCDVGERMLDPDVIKALKRSPMHPDLIRQWLERYCYDLTDEWLEHWLAAWEEEEGEGSSEDEEGGGEQPVGTARLPPPSGRRRALLVGCGYPGTPLHLKAPPHDVKYLRSLLSRFGYRGKHMQVLVDDGGASPPTRANLLDALRALAQDARPGDSLFFYFSGLGQGNRLPGDSETYLEGTTLCPSDWQESGLLEDDVLYELLVYPLPRGVKLTCVLDCHRHACTLDLPFEYEQSSGTLVCVNPVDLIKADVLLFAGGVHLTSPATAKGPLSPRARADSKLEGDHRSPMLQAFAHALLTAPHTPPTLRDVIQGLQAYIGPTCCARLPTLTASRGYTLHQPYVP